jgi:hypothetical protein
MDLALVSFLVLCGVIVIAYAGMHRRSRGSDGSSSTDMSSDDGGDGGGDGGGD